MKYGEEEKRREKKESEFSFLAEGEDSEDPVGSQRARVICVVRHSFDRTLGALCFGGSFAFSLARIRYDEEAERKRKGAEKG